jgi:hypothetical protein
MSDTRVFGKDGRTLQQVVNRMEEDRAKTGGYRASDVRRLTGDPVKGLGLTTRSTEKAEPKK